MPLKLFFAVCFLPIGQMACSAQANIEPRLVFGEKNDYLTVHACFSPNGKYVLASSEGDTLRLWDSSTGKVVQRYVWDDKKASRSIWQVGFSPDGTYVLACGQDCPLTVWETTNGKMLNKFSGPPTRAVERFAIADDGRTCVTSNFSNVLQLWDFTSGELKKTADRNGGDETMLLEFSRESSLLLATKFTRFTIWNATKLAFHRQIDVADFDEPLATQCAVFSSKGTTLLICTRTGKLLTVDGTTGEKAERFDLGVRNIARISSNRNRNRLGVGCTDGKVLLFSQPDFKRICEIRGFGTVQVSQDARMALTLQKDGRIAIWDLPDSKMTVRD